MRVFLDANVRFTAAKLPIVRAAHACKANVLLTATSCSGMTRTQLSPQECACSTSRARPTCPPG